MNKKNVLTIIVEFLKRLFGKECDCEECIEKGSERGIFCYKDEGRTEEMLSYPEVIEMLKHYDLTRIEPVERMLGYEDSRVNTFDFLQFKKYLGHIENLSKKAGIRITGISFINTVKPNHDEKEKGYGSLIYIPTTTMNGEQIAFDPVQSANRGKLVTFREMLAEYGYNWIYDTEGAYKEGKRKDNNYSIENLQKQESQKSENAQEVKSFALRGAEGESGAGNWGTRKPPY
ncbi:hypothetical protein [Tenacibaculum sp. 190524A02b]|uniref:hypothetical protein n=1 Tax=Tenacibaculum vairaonense TaxID=3137860 RepID=UPI0031FB0EE7